MTSQDHKVLSIRVLRRLYGLFSASESHQDFIFPLTVEKSEDCQVFCNSNQLMGFVNLWLREQSGVTTH